MAEDEMHSDSFYKEFAAEFTKDQFEYLCRKHFDGLAKNASENEIMRTLKEAYYTHLDVNLKFENQDISLYAFCLGIKNRSALKLDDFEGMLERYVNTELKADRCGAAIVNESKTQVLLIKSFYSQYLKFPVGKLDEGEDEVAAAEREVWEEVGQMIPLDGKAKLIFDKGIHKEHVYIFCGVDIDTPFAPKTLGEVEIVKGQTKEHRSLNICILPLKI